MKSLIIVESFTKTKTIKKYINDDNYIVTFTSGHIYNLPKDKLGFDTELAYRSNEYTYLYVSRPFLALPRHDSSAKNKIYILRKS